MNRPVDALLDAFLRISKDSAPADIKARILHLQHTYLHPEEHTTDHSPFALRDKRRGARQGLKRLKKRYPALAIATMQEDQASQEAA
jgi:hypothetical protein